jgi:plastocyanin
VAPAAFVRRQDANRTHGRVVEVVVHHFRVLSVTTAALGLSVGFAACGDDDDSSDSVPAATTQAPAGSTAAPSEAAAEAAITISGRSFGEPLTVAAGTTVTVTNDSPETHTLTADDGSFDTDGLESGATAQLTFDEPGTFPFHCEIHPSMQGSITVTG